MELVGRMMALGRLKTLGLVAVVLVGSVGGAFALGVVGTPAVESAENRFTGVSTETTTVETALVVNNPNPIGVQLGGVGIDYTVFMNDVPIAEGSKDGLSLARGNSTVPFTTAMDNEQIPPWWVSHIRNDERTQVTIDADVSSSLLGGRSVSLTQNRTVETEIIDQFNSTETRPVETDSPVVSDPALYINATRGSWDQSNVTQSQTPLNVEFDVHNPKAYPYTVTEIGYTARMNDIAVGNGSTERGYIIAPGETQTVGVDTVIRNENLDEWWVSHLQNNQVTEVYIDFYLVVDTGSEQFRIDLDAIDYENTIETDIFGNKADYPTGDASDTDGETESGSDDTDDGDSVTDTVTGDDGVLSGGDSVTDTVTGSDDNTTENTPTTDGTATDDGIVGGL